MFSFLRTGDIHTTIRKMTSLPGLSISDTDKIKYALLNHSSAMRANLSGGAPIFANIRQWEAELERRDIASMMSGVLPSMAANAAAAAASSSRLSLFTDNDPRIDNAALALIMAKELAFLNRTIQMISLIANRYNEEQQDLVWGRDDDNDNDNDDDDDDGSSDEEDLECGGVTLQRSQSHDHPYTPPAASATNQLATTFLIASGRLMTRFNGLCELADTNVIIVNAMTTRDPHSSADNLETQLSPQSLVISDIFLHFGKFGAEHRDPVVLAFLELRDISVSAWKIMSMFAFSNLFRLTAGTEYAMCYQPEDAIFAQGRDMAIPEPCCGGGITGEATTAETTELDVVESYW
jgi:hypothetical protein